MESATAAESGMCSTSEVRFIGSDIGIKILVTPAISNDNFIEISTRVSGIRIHCSDKELVILDRGLHYRVAFESVLSYKIVLDSEIVMATLESRAHSDEVEGSFSMAFSLLRTILVKGVYSPSLPCSREDGWEDFSEKVIRLVVVRNLYAELCCVHDCFGDEEDSYILGMSSLHPLDKEITVSESSEEILFLGAEWKRAPDREPFAIDRRLEVISRNFNYFLEAVFHYRETHLIMKGEVKIRLYRDAIFSEDNCNEEE